MAIAGLGTDIVEIPHPQMQHRRFVLIPFAEIAADYIHPALHKSIGQLLKECIDNSEVTLLEKSLNPER